MDLFEIAKKLKGLQTVSTISEKLNVKERTAVNYVWKLRKEGYLTTYAGGNKVRIYRVSLIKHRKKSGYSLYELINKNSRIKLAISEDYIIHSEKKPSIEEILVRAIISKRYRTMLAALELFNKVKNWSRLRYFADKYKVGRQVGALYDVTRKFIRVKRMDERTRKALLRSRGDKYIIRYVKSKSFRDIEKLWRVFIPLNNQDMDRYKEW